MKYKQANTHDRSDTLGRWGKCATGDVLFQVSELDPNGMRKQHPVRVELKENSMCIIPNEGKGVRKYTTKLYLK